MASRIQPTNFVTIYSNQFASGKMSFDYLSKCYLEHLRGAVAAYKGTPQNSRDAGKIRECIAIDTQIINTLIDAQESCSHMSTLGKTEALLPFLELIGMKEESAERKPLGYQARV